MPVVAEQGNSTGEIRVGGIVEAIPVGDGSRQAWKETESRQENGN